MDISQFEQTQAASDLVQYGWGGATAARFISVLQSGLMPGRIVRVDRGRLQVATHNGITPCVAGRHLGEAPLAVGDWVTVRPEPGYDLIVEDVVERTSAIMRRDPSPGDNRDQILAANVDKVFVLCGLDGDAHLGGLERYLVMIWDSGAIPVVVLTKADLVDPADVAATLAAVAGNAPGVEVHVISCVTEAGVAALAGSIAAGATIALVGESGSGKSTLVNTLAGEEILLTGATRDSDGKGRHTTTARQLVPLPGGAVLIDTPGLRAVGLAEGSIGVAQVFADVIELMDGCKFRNCSHRTEPGCAIVEAIAAGDLERRRFDSYLRLEKEQARVASRQEALVSRAERKQVARNRLKSARQSREP